MHESDFEAEQNARFDRRPKFRAVDCHEIDQLARSREAERFDRKDSSRLRQRLDDQDARHDRTAGEMTGKEGFVDRDSLDRDDALIDDEFLDAIDEQHREAMRQRRHHSPNVDPARY